MFAKAKAKRGKEIAIRVEKVDGVTPPLSLKEDGSPDAPSLPWDQWTSWTWDDYYNDVRKCAKVDPHLSLLSPLPSILRNNDINVFIYQAFMHCGVDQFDAVNIFGFNSPEWFIADVGVIFAGGKAAGIYPTDTLDQVVYKSKHSGGKVIVVETEQKLELIKSRVSELPVLTTMVVWGPGFESKGKSFKGLSLHLDILKS